MKNFRSKGIKTTRRWKERLNSIRNSFHSNTCRDFPYIYIYFAGMEWVVSSGRLVEIRSFQGQRVQQIRRQRRREGPGATRAPCPAAPVASPLRVRRVSLRRGRVAHGVLHAHQVRVRDRFHLVRGHHGVRVGRRRGWTSRGTALRLHAATHGAGGPAVHAYPALGRRFLLGQPLLLPEFRAPILKPHLQSFPHFTKCERFFREFRRVVLLLFTIVPTRPRIYKYMHIYICMYVSLNRRILSADRVIEVEERERKKGRVGGRQRGGEDE